MILKVAINITLYYNTSLLSTYYFYDSKGIAIGEKK